MVLFERKPVVEKEDKEGLLSIRIKRGQLTSC